MRTLRLGVLQFASALREPSLNRRRISEWNARGESDLLLTPELSLTGYHLADDTRSFAVAAEVGQQLAFDGERTGSGAEDHAIGAPTRDRVVGFVERGRSGLPYNAAAVLRAARVRFVQRKIYLPTYGMFDEGRYFANGKEIGTFETSGGWRVGILICEDFWHPSLAYLHATAGVDLLLVMAAAPGRGLWNGGEEGGRYESWDSWRRIARVSAELYGMYIAVANRVGVEGGVTFAGGSLIVDPLGRIIAAAGSAEEELLEVELDPEEIARSRGRGGHFRDDDPHFTLRELRRITGSE